jgi:hypothetical protein
MSDLQPLTQTVDLKHALAVAVVQRRRHDAQSKRWQERCQALQQQIDELKQQADGVADSSRRRHPLAVLCSEQPDAAGSSQHSPADAQSTLASLMLWSRAVHALPPEECQSFLGRVQRYILMKEAAAGGAAPTAGLLARTPAGALLEALTDLLEATSGGGDTQMSHPAACISQAADCLAALCGRPDEGLGNGDGESVHQFTAWLVHLACTPQQQHEPQTSNDDVAQDGGSADAAAAPPAAAAAPTPLHAGALLLLERLAGSPGTGLLVLSCTAEAAHSCITALVESITGDDMGAGEPPAGQPPRPDGGSGEAAHEAALLQAHAALSALLQRCLRALPEWSGAAGPGEEFLRNVAGSVWGANEACRLLTLTQPAAARQVQRSTALLVAALQQISAAGGRGP